MSNPPALDIAVRVQSRTQLAHGTERIVLVRTDGGELPAFDPGAHVTLRTPSGQMRRYALCNNPAERKQYELAVRHGEPGSAAADIVANASVGTELAISQPANDFELPRNAQAFVFIAGGIGIAPIMSMLRQVANEDGKTFRLYYMTRSREATAFHDELNAAPFKGKVTLHHDGGDPQRWLDLWPALEERKNRAHLYCCGPRSLMESVRDMSGHWPRTAIHFESFEEAKAVKASDRPFTVKLARSDTIVEVPVGTTILEALRAAGHDGPSSCESGTCGTCRTRLLAGDADHRDFVLAEDERAGNIMICVSRSKSPQLVIDR